MQKSTKIVCTLGPESNSLGIILKMVESGMNVARLNFSHGTHTSHKKVIDNIKKARKKLGQPIAIIQDLSGPKIRIGILPEEGVELKAGKIVFLDTSIKKYKKGIIPVEYKLHKIVSPKERIFLNDGQCEIKVVKIEDKIIECKVIVGGVLFSHKGINIPDSNFKESSLTKKDKEDLFFGIKNGIDFVALSFVSSAKDITKLRRLIKKYEKEIKVKKQQPLRILAKIERGEAIKNIEEIIDASDGVMIARGDLGIEMPIQRVPLMQKKIIDLAIDKEKPVIVATQMLESMTKNNRPTRAEVSDIANAVIDSTDAVMLSEETAKGKYPVRSVQIMSDIIKETEKSTYDDKPLKISSNSKYHVDDIISRLSRLLAEQIDAKLILSASVSGDTGRLLSSYRPKFPLMVGTYTERVYHQLALSWGVNPFMLKSCNMIEELVKKCVIFLKSKDLLSKGDKIIVVAGEPIGESGHVNLLEVRDI
jgi:pyruvate kinase